MTEIRDPAMVAQMKAQEERFRRNSDWLQAHVPRVYAEHRGKHICVAGGELFVADTAEEVLARARAAHPEDDGLLFVTFPASAWNASMLISGRWLLCDDGIVRPIFEADALAADGSWHRFEFLADVGADRTVFAAGALAALGVPFAPAPQQLGGVGGAAPTVAINTSIRFRREDGSPVLFQGTFAAFTQPESLDMSVVGRDITNLFAVIVDRPGDTVCVLCQRHRYTISDYPDCRLV